MRDYYFWLGLPYAMKITNPTFVEKVSSYQTELKSIDEKMKEAKI